MKNHFLSLFEPSHRWWTLSYLIFSVVLIVGAMLVGVADNLPGIAMLLGGMIFLFITFLHTWRNVKNYITLLLVCFGIIVLIFLAIILLSAIGKTQYINEGFVMILGFLFCFPGILVGIGGVIVESSRKK